MAELKAELQGQEEKTEIDNLRLSVIDAIERQVAQAELALRDHPDSPQGRILLLQLADAIYPRASLHAHDAKVRQQEPGPRFAAPRERPSPFRLVGHQAVPSKARLVCA